MKYYVTNDIWMIYKQNIEVNCSKTWAANLFKWLLFAKYTCSDSIQIGDIRSKINVAVMSCSLHLHEIVDTTKQDVLNIENIKNMLLRRFWTIIMNFNENLNL